LTFEFTEILSIRWTFTFQKPRVAKLSAVALTRLETFLFFRPFGQLSSSRIKRVPKIREKVTKFFVQPLLL